MRYYSYKDELGKEHCILRDGEKYTDFLTGEEFYGDKTKLVSITPVEAQNFCNQEVGKNIKLDNDTVIILIKPTEAAYTFHVLLSELSKNCLSIVGYIPHMFTSEEVEVLYDNLKKRSITEFEKNKFYLISDESALAIVNGKNARAIMEEKIGDKNSKIAKDNTIRSEIGWDTTCNGIEIVDDVPKKLSVIKPIIREYAEANDLKNNKTYQKAIL